MPPFELFIHGNVLPSQDKGSSSPSEGRIDGHLICSTTLQDDERSDNRRLSKIMAMLHNSPVLQVFKWLPQRKSKASAKSDNYNRGSKGKGRSSHMINLKALVSFGNAEGESGRHPNAPANYSSQHRSEFCKQRAGVIERDASVSDAIAHCRLSFDGANKL